MTAKKKECWACQQGNPRSPYTGSHGFSVVGIGMLDTTCPISKADYDGILSMARDVQDEMASTPKDPT